MKRDQFAFDDAVAAHESTFDCSDLCECITPDILEALRNGDELEAGRILANNMRALIRDRAFYATEDA